MVESVTSIKARIQTPHAQQQTRPLTQSLIGIQTHGERCQKPTLSFYYPFRIIGIRAGPLRPCLGGILCTLDESSAIMPLSDLGFTAALCLVLLRSPNKQAKTTLETQRENLRPPASPKTKTHKQTYLSAARRSTTDERLFTEHFEPPPPHLYRRIRAFRSPLSLDGEKFSASLACCCGFPDEEPLGEGMGAQVRSEPF